MSMEQKIRLFRNRFVAREDVYSIHKVYEQKIKDPETGVDTLKTGKFLMPACVNYENKDLCLIAQKKGKCIDCSNKNYATLTDDVVAKHISGEQIITLFMLREEGIRFGAADFDRGNTFEDAKAVRDLSMSLGIPCYIARSTQKGYHVYWFFKEYVEAHKFTSFMRHLFDQLGFYARWNAEPEVGLPEVFPKQSRYGNTNLGNGIKIPMIEPNMIKGTNCWVDDGAIPIPADQQWGFFEKTILISKEEFEKVLETAKVDIIEAPVGRGKAEARRVIDRAVGDRDVNVSKIYKKGSFANIIEGCPAMREYWARNPKTKKYLWDESNKNGLFHNARLSSAILAQTTEDGMDFIKERWPGAKTEYHTSDIAKHGYLPTTCQWMQLNGVCNRTKHPRKDGVCMHKKPPVVNEDGVIKVNPDNLPEEHWPEPSPVRYATDRSLSPDDVVYRLSLIYSSKKKKKDEPQDEIAVKFDEKTGHPVISYIYTPENRELRINQLMDKVFSFEEVDISRIREAVVKTYKWQSAAEWKAHEKKFKRVSAEKAEEEFKKNSEKMFRFGTAGEEFHLRDGRYWRIWHDAKDIRREEELTNFTVQIVEESVLLRLNEGDELASDTTIEDRSVKGYIDVDKQQIPFQVSITEWMGSGDAFFKMLMRHAGTGLMFKRPNFDNIRTCIGTFSKETKIINKQSKQIGHHRVKLANGTSKNAYLMPSVMVTEDGIIVNDEYGIEFADEVSRGLDFKIISDEEFRHLATHIVTDFFNCNNRKLTMTTFAHAMAAAIGPQINDAVGYKKAPVLFLSGDFGQGKTFVAEVAQRFYGNFDASNGSGGSAKAKIAAAHNFRHAMMLIDDFKKALTDPSGKSISEFIQNAYDRRGRAALQRDGTMRKQSDRVRGLIVVTGEDYPDNEASSISRMILIDSKLQENREHGQLVIDNQHDYCGFTPHLIHFVYNIKPSDIADIWNGYSERFLVPVREEHKANAVGRICENLTLNMTAFRLTMDLMVVKGAIPDTAAAKFCEEHFENLVTIRDKTLDIVSASKASNVFIEGLRELLQNPNKHFIYGLDPAMDSDYKNAQIVGFWKETRPDIVYINPNIATSEVEKMYRNANRYLQSQQQICRQLETDGYISRSNCDSGRLTKTISGGPTKSKIRCIPIFMDKLGLEIPKRGPMGVAKPEPVVPTKEVTRVF